MMKCPTMKIVKYGGASSARTAPSGAVQAGHAVLTRSQPVNMADCPHAGQRPAKPRRSACIIVGIGQPGAGAVRSGCQRTVMVSGMGLLL
jgi:hypothetical protein